MSMDFPNSPAEGQIYAPANGPKYVFNSPVWKVLSQSTPVDVEIVETVWTSSGTFTKSGALLYLEVIVQGAGGAAGGCPATGAGQVAIGSGGGGGGYSRSLLDAASVPASVSVTVGAAGAGVSGGTGGTGGASSFGSLGTGGGGVGGAAVISTSPTVGYANGGGAGSASAGQINIVGMAGGPGLTCIGSSPAYSYAGAGGNAVLGLAPATVFAGSFGPINAQGYGAGGLSGGSGASMAAKLGGNGAPGVVITREYYFKLATAPSNAAPVQRTITSSSTWTKPLGCTHIEIEGCGAGGAGGGGDATGGAASMWAGGAGGASGASGSAGIIDVSGVSSIALTIGAGGVGVVGGTGGSGGDTTAVVGGTTYTWGGALGGNFMTIRTDTTGIKGPQGVVGTNITYTSSYGGDGFSLAPTCGLSGNGGSSLYGRGGFGARATGVTATAGNNANGYGSGGGGAALAGTSTSRAGGNGTQGLLIITEYYGLK